MASDGEHVNVASVDRRLFSRINFVLAAFRETLPDSQVCNEKLGFPQVLERPTVISSVGVYPLLFKEKSSPARAGLRSLKCFDVGASCMPWCADQSGRPDPLEIFSSADGEYTGVSKPTIDVIRRLTIEIQLRTRGRQADVSAAEFFQQLAALTGGRPTPFRRYSFAELYPNRPPDESADDFIDEGERLGEIVFADAIESEDLRSRLEATGEHLTGQLIGYGMRLHEPRIFRELAYLRIIGRQF